MLTKEQLESMGLVVVVIDESTRFIEAAANPENEASWRQWANIQATQHNLNGWLWEYEHPITRV